MKRTLQGSKSKKKPLPDVEELTRQAQQMNPSELNDVQKIVQQYAGKSEAELLRELHMARQSGAINPAELSSVAQKIAPMLTAEQQQRLTAVMRQLR